MFRLVVWFGVIGLVRVILEDALCIGRDGLSSPIEIGHMVTWWISVGLAYTLILRRYVGKVPKKFIVLGFIWILSPPLLDWALIQRDFDYAYPVGNFAFYIYWTIAFMPTYVTVGQKIEIVGALLISASYVLGKRKSLGEAVAMPTVFYVVMTFYAWYPAALSNVPGYQSNHDAIGMGLMAVLILWQGHHLARDTHA